MRLTFEQKVELFLDRIFFWSFWAVSICLIAVLILDISTISSPSDIHVQVTTYGSSQSTCAKMTSYITCDKMTSYNTLEHWWRSICVWSQHSKGTYQLPFEGYFPLLIISPMATAPFQEKSVGEGRSDLGTGVREGAFHVRVKIVSFKTSPDLIADLLKTISPSFVSTFGVPRMRSIHSLLF